MNDRKRETYDFMKHNFYALLRCTKKLLATILKVVKKFNIAVCITIFWTYTTSVGRITFKGYRQSVTIHWSKFHPKTLQQHREKWNLKY